MRTISLKFFLKPIKHGRYAFSVNLRIIYDRKKAEIATGIRCDKKEWDAQKEGPKKIILITNISSQKLFWNKFIFFHWKSMSCLQWMNVRLIKGYF